MDNKKIEEFINYLKGKENSIWIARMDGEFEIAVSFACRHLRELNDILIDIDDTFENYIQKRQITSVLFGNYYSRDYLLDNGAQTEVKKRKVTFDMKSSNLIKMDKTNHSILKEMANNTRKSSLEIANKLGLSVDTIIERIKKMENSGLIQNNTIVLNNSILNQSHYKILLRLHNLNKIKQNGIIEYMKNQRNICFVNETLGDWEMEVDIEIGSAEEFRKLLNDIKSKFSDIISSMSVLNIYCIEKYNFFPFDTQHMTKL